MISEKSFDALASARRTLAIESAAVMGIAQRLDHRFEEIVLRLLACTGRIVVSGVGKSGHIARKIAATLASTGTPAFFVHAAEAAHGDLGMVTAQDIFIGLSYSGETAELLALVPSLRRQGSWLVMITGQPQSQLALVADLHLDASVDQEACPLNLAPTASSTAALALGDALAVACLQARGFGPEDFARSHPGGVLGRRLLTHVKDVMRHGARLPRVQEGATVTEALLEISSKGMGMTAVVNSSGQLKGIFTDGDLRRLIERLGDVRACKVQDGMSTQPLTIEADALAIDAAALMDAQRKNQLLVLNTKQELVGALHMHDLLAAKIL